MQWSSVVPTEYSIGLREGIDGNDCRFRIQSERGFKAAIACAFIDVIVSVTVLTIILALSPLLLSPPPPKLITMDESFPPYFAFNYTTNETIYFPANMSETPMEKTFYCEKIGRQVVLADFLTQMIYTAGGISVVFGAVTKRTSFCYLHFPCSLTSITIGVGIRIIELIYCKWFLMRWLWFVIQFAWYSLGDAVAKSLTAYMEDKERQMERTTQGILIVPNT